MTGQGGEGMVVKPRAFLARDQKGRIVQPALKARGRDDLRIIYGPDYDRPDNLARLRERALDHEGLLRFAAGEPLRRWHDCVLGVLAMESEPVDPRL